MNAHSTLFIGLGLLLGLAQGCGNGRSSSPPPSNQTAQTDQLIVTAGLAPLTPVTSDTVSGTVDLSPLGSPQVDAVYDVTTPAGEAFAFNAFVRGQGNAGAVRVSVAHLLDAGAAPAGNASSISEAGVVPLGSGLVDRDPWLDSQGDGFARVTLQGSVQGPQVYAVQAETPLGLHTALVRVRLGSRSQINLEQQTSIPAPFVIDQRTLYSSDSWQFGLPVCATSGDRTTVVVYEGDDGDEFSPNRYELRLQYDQASGAVTGGASDEGSADFNNWRDHELAALFNTLAVVHTGQRELTCRLSFDRGATIAQTSTLDSGSGPFNLRLVQCAMADDYSLAVVYWRTGADFVQELVLVEGAPSGYDQSQNPTGFSFQAPQVLHRTSGDATPAIIGAAWSEGGDLVVGYGFSTWEPNPNQPGSLSRSQFRCATRLFGQPDFTDTLVEEDVTFNYDPSVSLRGQGQGLNIYYAYEAGGGVRLATSADAGQSFGAPQTLGTNGAHLPTVLATPQGQATRVDLLYLQPSPQGTELHLVRWDDYAQAAPQAYQLTSGSAVTDASGAVTGTTGIAWLGYDATLDGDDVVIVYQETTEDWTVLPMPVALGAPGALGAPTAAAAGGFTAATPPPLAPGLTTPLAAPDAADRHQLKLMRLD